MSTRLYLFIIGIATIAIMLYGLWLVDKYKRINTV